MKTVKRIKSITICSSASFYREVIEIKNELRKQGFAVFVPVTALKMQRANDYTVAKHKVWYDNPKLYHQKTAKMKGHLRQIDKGDAILVVNLKKKGIDGYIGGNVLLEMFYAWMLRKPIIVLNPISDKCTLKEEVLGMGPSFLGGNVSELKKIK